MVLKDLRKKTLRKSTHNHIKIDFGSFVMKFWHKIIDLLNREGILDLFVKALGSSECDKKKFKSLELNLIQ